MAIPFMVGFRTKTKPKPDGRRERRVCPKCGKLVDFVEGVREEAFTAFIAIDVASTDSVVWGCPSCQEWMSFDATQAPPLTEKERAKKDADVVKAARAREKKVDDELEALKKKLGK